MTFSSPRQRICTFWRDETGPGEEKFGVTPCRCVLARKVSEFFLAGTHRQGKMLKRPKGLVRDRIGIK